MYVMASHVTKVALLVNGTSVASSLPTYSFLYLPQHHLADRHDRRGRLRRQRQGGHPARDPDRWSSCRLKLTAQTAPGGLKADGADVFFADVEVVDAQGRRVPTDQARVDFAVTGPGKCSVATTPASRTASFKTYANTECGINRIFVRGSRTPGTITLQVTRSGLTSRRSTHLDRRHQRDLVEWSSLPA